MELTAAQLCGTPADVARLMGMPHFMARYRREDYRSHELAPGALCAVCGAPAAEAHHVVPRSRARGFTVNTPIGRFTALSPLFAVCRACHDGFPSGFGQGPPRFSVRWEWACGEFERMWWSGRIPASMPPGSPGLYRFGHYEIEDAATGLVVAVRKESA